jgi:arylsulfatase A
MAALPAAAARPNVILIMTDDQGYGDLSCHGNTQIRTPNLDLLAGQGAEFTRFYVSPVCAPTRAALMTGRYNIRCGVHGVTGGRETMATDEVTVAETLRDAGYRTALIGKWHLGELYPYVPHGQGFDEFVGMRTGHWNNYFDSLIEKNGKPYRTKGYIADALTEEAMRFVQQDRGRPFFLYLAYNTPHSPFQAPETLFQRFVSRGMSRQLASVYAMVENLDDNIGRLLAHVEELGLARDTILIFLTDNGPAGDRYNAGLRGRKASVYEGGVRVPFFIRWPGRIPAGKKIGTIAAHIDVRPTLLDLCGVKAAAGRPMDGMSLRPLLEGKSAGWPDRPIFTHSERPRNETALYPGAIRTQRFNLVNGKELYEIPADPGEKNDVSAKYPEKAAELRGRYEDWFRTVLAERGFRRYPLPVGHPEENPAYLPATQAQLGGNLQYHGKAGYAHDWIEGWDRIEDEVAWDIEIARPGNYAVSLEYLCGADDLGAEIEIGVGGKTARAGIKQATPLEPKPDRNLVPGTHYITMNWARLPFGPLALPAGRTRLIVRALKKPGRTVMQLKAAVAEYR